jgi:hypothetical protein
MTIHELFQGCRRYLIKVDRLENVKISGGDSDAGRVEPVLEFYENVSSPSRLEICLKFIGDQVAGLKVPVHRFIVASVLHAGDGYTVSSAKASSVIVAFEIFHLLLWVQHFLKYTNERSLPRAAPRITPRPSVAPRPSALRRRAARRVTTSASVCAKIPPTSDRPSPWRCVFWNARGDVTRCADACTSNAG